MKYCLHGFLGQQQRETLYFLDIIASVLQETHVQSTLPKLEDMNVGLALLERNFPMSTQVRT